MIPPRESPDEIFQHVCGAQIGQGQHRTAHQVIGYPELVMKVARYNHFSNWCEDFVSRQFGEREAAFRIGRVASISATGKFLLMERLNDLDRSLEGEAIPSWLNDKKASAFGISAQGEVKIRDYGTLILGNLLGTQQYIFDEDRVPVTKKVPDGADEAFAALAGRQLGNDGSRSVHEVPSDPTKVLKICAGSHRENAIEWIIYCALAGIDAEELAGFASFECSRTAKYVLTDRLRDLTAECESASPAAPKWLRLDRSALGADVLGTVKIRRWSDVELGELLTRAPFHRIPIKPKHK